MARTEAQKRASAKYNKDHTKLFTMRLQLNGDEDIMAYLDALPNKQGRVKDLIRADIARANSGKKEEEKKMKYQVNYTDPTTGANSPIDTITARAGYTAEDYIRDCNENADSDWCEMLHRGEVSLELIEPAPTWGGPFNMLPARLFNGTGLIHYHRLHQRSFGPRDFWRTVKGRGHAGQVPSRDFLRVAGFVWIPFDDDGFCLVFIAVVVLQEEDARYRVDLSGQHILLHQILEHSPRSF